MRERSYGSTLYGGGIYYTRQILGGYMGANLNVFDSTIDGNSSMTIADYWVQCQRELQPADRAVAGGRLFQLRAERADDIGDLQQLLLQLLWKRRRRLGRLYWTAERRRRPHRPFGGAGLKQSQ